MEEDKYKKGDKKEDLVPKSQVLLDMENPDGGMIALAARDYYYQHYATPAEREMMDAEDRRNTWIARIIGFLFMSAIIFALVKGCGLV